MKFWRRHPPQRWRLRSLAKNLTGNPSVKWLATSETLLLVNRVNEPQTVHRWIFTATIPYTYCNWWYWTCIWRIQWRSTFNIQRFQRKSCHMFVGDQYQRRKMPTNVFPPILPSQFFPLINKMNVRPIKVSINFISLITWTKNIWIGRRSCRHASVQPPKLARKLYDEILSVSLSPSLLRGMNKRFSECMIQNTRSLPCHDLAISFVCCRGSQRTNCWVYSGKDVNFTHLPFRSAQTYILLDAGRRIWKMTKNLMGMLHLFLYCGRTGDLGSRGSWWYNLVRHFIIYGPCILYVNVLF